MEKGKTYERVIFTADVIKKALAHWSDRLTNFGELSILRKPEKWKYDNEDEFFSDYRNEFDEAIFTKIGKDCGLRIHVLYETYDNKGRCFCTTRD